MANGHLLRALQTLILTFPCIIALASFSMWPQTQDLVAISPPATDHHHRRHHHQQQQQRNHLHPGAASIRGRRIYQEDRLVCAPDLQMPSLSDGNYSLLTTAGLYGVFDGHVGDEASDFAATSIMQRFLHHVSHLAGISSSCTSQLLVGSGQPNASTTCFNWSMAERALRDSIADIDASFHMEATKHGLKSGSTACVMLHIDNQILVANVGDSKALVCSSCGGAKRDESFGEQVNGLDYKGHLMRSKRTRSSMSRSSKKAVHTEGLCVQELSSDHRPDRSDEKLRIESSGGFVTSGTLSRVNGQLAVSRSIGDIEFKRFGVTSEPEISSWHVSENDTFLVLASDGIFERMNPQDVCNVLHAAESGQDITAVLGGLKEDNALIALPLPGMELPKPDFNRDVHKLRVDANPTMLANHAATVDACFREDSFKVDSWSADILSETFWRGATGMAHVMAQILVEVAYRAGSMDNLSALVIPLKQSVPEYL